MIYLFLANGFEEIEALTPTDVLRRAGADIKTVSINDTLEVTGAHGITVKADILLNDYNFENSEMIILPGGSDGTKNLGENPKIREIILEANERGIYIAAICAAPTILAKMGLLKGLKATCYPSLANVLIDNKVKYRSEKVVTDKHFITSMGAGTSGEFAFVLTDKTIGRSESDNLRISMVY